MTSADQADGLKGWYSNPDDNAASNEILTSTFHHAQLLLRGVLKPVDYATLFPLQHEDIDSAKQIRNHTIYEVQRVLREAQSTYECRTGFTNNALQGMEPTMTATGVSTAPVTAIGRARVKSRVWLTGLAEKIVHYGNIFDVMAQHHPEYVSLAWGTFKLVFIAITNHADTASKLSKSISQIADLLPAHSLHLILYPTPQMQTSVARLYAHVLNFFLSSLKWYKDNAAVHAIKSIFQPWDLKFRHEYDAIAAESKQIRRLADVAMKAEVRDTRLEVVQSSKQWDSMRQAVNDLKDENKQLTELLNSRFADMKSSMFCMYQEMRLDFSSQRETLNRVHLNQMLSLPIWDSLPSSGESLQFCRSLRRRNRQLPRLSQLDLNTLEAWSEKQRSSFLLINSSVPVMARTFMVDLIDLILENRLPIIWALRYSDYWDRRTSTTDVMRILLVQCMQLGADRLLDGPFPLTVEQLREAASLDDWVALLSQLLSRVGNAFLVLDAALLEHATSFERCEILEMLEVLRSKLSSNVKIVTSSSMVGRAYTEELESADACFTLNAGDWLDFRKGRTRRQPRRAHQKLDHRPVSR